MNNFAVMTTLNEADTIGWLVSTLSEGLDLRVCVVDDASDDDTAYLARHAGAHVIQHVLRTGIGPSLVEGWRWALDQGAEGVVQLDAGASHSPYAAPWMLDELSKADMVIGSRFCHGGRHQGDLRRRMLSRAAALACNVRYCHALTGISDWTSGYRAFRPAALRKLARLEYKATMHGWQIEVLLAARWLELRVAEMPISYIAGVSSFNRRIAKEAFGVWNSQRFASQS